MAGKVFTEETQTQRACQKAGTLSTSQVALTTNKIKAVVEALTSTGIALVAIDHGVPAVAFRFRTDADADTNVLNIYAMRGDDHYALIATITLTGGTQIDGDVGVFCDTIAITDGTEVWPTSMAAMSTANDSIAELAFNTHGVSKLLFIATTLAGTLQIDGVAL